MFRVGLGGAYFGGAKAKGSQVPGADSNTASKERRGRGRGKEQESDQRNDMVSVALGVSGEHPSERLPATFLQEAVRNNREWLSCAVLQHDTVARHSEEDRTERKNALICLNPGVTQDTQDRLSVFCH